MIRVKIARQKVQSSFSEETHIPLGRKLRYDVIYKRLRESIVAGRIVPGFVLLEGPVANVFGTSRAPVRKALNLLVTDGLLTKFDGRGYLASPLGQPVVPQRLPLNAASLGLDANGGSINIPSESERIYDELERSISTCIVFGHFRIDEAAVVEYFHVNRTAVREVLSRLVDRGLVEKAVYSYWGAGPLTARGVRQDYELRLLLEPAALKVSGPHLDRAFLTSLLESLGRMLKHPESTSAAELDRIEQQIHRDCLAHHPNRKMLEVINHCQMPQVVERAFSDALNLPVESKTVEEHMRIVEHLLDGDYGRATQALGDHLQASSKRTQEKLKVLAVLPEPALPNYLIRLA